MGWGTSTLPSPSPRGITGCHETRPAFMEEAPQPTSAPLQAREGSDAVTSKASSFGRLPGPVAQGGHVPSSQAGLLVSSGAALTKGTLSLGGGGEATLRRRQRRGPVLGTRGKRPAGTRGMSSGDMCGVDGTSGE